METDIYSRLQKSLTECLQSIETSKPGSHVIKISQRVSEGDFIIFTNEGVNEETLLTVKDISKNSESPIQSVKVQKNRILISLYRTDVFSKCIHLIHSVSSKYGFSSQFSKEKINFMRDDEISLNDLTNFRVNFLVETAKNLASAVGFTAVENNHSNQTLYFTHKSNSSTNDVECRLVLCGVVQNAETKAKETNITVPEYRSIKNKILTEEMKDRDKLMQNVSVLLTDALLKFNLLHTKVSSPVVMNFSTALEDFDGTAIFIMYNYSRLNAIIHEYEDRVQKKYYPELPPINSVDFSILKEEKEWVILFNYLLQFPNVVLNTVKDIKEGRFAPFLLYNFLHNMSRAVSSYYRSTKILLYNRPQLFSIIVARMYLIKAVHQVFTNGLNLLLIQPVPAL